MNRRRERRGSGTMVLVLALIWTLITESSSGDPFISRHIGRFPPSLYPRQDEVDPPESLHLHHPHRHLHHRHRQPPDTLTNQMSASPLQPSGHRNLDLLTRPHHDVQPEHAAVSSRHLVTVYLAVDVRRLNVSLLRWFREGVAAALGVPAGHVHINQLNEKKNGIELFVSSDRLGTSEPRPAEEVIQSLNVRVLHRHLGHFGITEVSTEKNVLQGQQRDHVWSREGFYAIVLFFTVFVIVITCLMLLILSTWRRRRTRKKPGSGLMWNFLLDLTSYKRLKLHLNETVFNFLLVVDVILSLISEI